MPDAAVTLCRDPECGGVADEEQDGLLRFLACPRCGYEFDHRYLSGGASEQTCAVGIPEDLRRRASPRAGAGPVLVQIGRRPDDAHCGA